MVSIFGCRLDFRMRRKKKGRAEPPGRRRADHQSNNNNNVPSDSLAVRDGARTVTPHPRVRSQAESPKVQPEPSSAGQKPRTSSLPASPHLSRRPWVDPLAVHFARPLPPSTVAAPLWTGSSLRNTPDAYEQYCGAGDLKTPRPSWSMSPNTTGPPSPAALEGQTDDGREGEARRSREVGTQTSPGLMRSLGGVGAEHKITAVAPMHEGPVRARSQRGRIESLLPSATTAAGPRPRTSHGPTEAHMHRAHRPSPLNLQAGSSASPNDGACSAVQEREEAQTTASAKDLQTVGKTGLRSSPCGGVRTPTSGYSMSSLACLPGTPASVALAARICHSPPLSGRMPATPRTQEGKQER